MKTEPLTHKELRELAWKHAIEYGLYVICGNCDDMIHDEPEHNQEYSLAHDEYLKVIERYRNEEEHQEAE